ncbi:serine hydrolase [Spiractinospora alimapuensis]|uniref:serine hydrolase domain-containing protein n=1 Tax=Spiractinospora alimapuensis TaxID=2820884 RepID=UPI001F3C8730|nr:serine hydrolase [Spiractinospora alimapuensis]QVQ51496.1 serine hydrolase [Spiractinospora alimapuensis]
MSSRHPAQDHRVDPGWGLFNTVVITAAITGLLAYPLAPRPYDLGREVVGDQELARNVWVGMEGDRVGYHGLAVATVERLQEDQTHVRGAGLGTEGTAGEPVAPDTRMAASPIAGVLPGMILADMVERDEVALDSTVGDLLPELDPADPDLTDVTMEELGTHTSGVTWTEAPLPNQLWDLATKQPSDKPRSVSHFLERVSTEAEVDDERRGEREYSHTGLNLLGHALAAAADQEYADLARERIFAPLGMEDTEVWTTATGWSPPLVHDADVGRPIRFTSTEADGPAEGLVTTAADLSSLVKAMIDGSAPGHSAALPRTGDPREGPQHGLGWQIEKVGDHLITTYGGTASRNGHAAWIAFSGNRGAVVMSNTHRGAEDITLRLMGVRDPDRDDNRQVLLSSWATVLPTLLPSVAVLAFALRRRPGVRWRRQTDRAGLVAYSAIASSILTYTYLVGFWHRVPPWVWILGVVLTALAIALGVRRWPDLPAVRGPRRWLRRLLLIPITLGALGAVLLLGPMAADMTSSVP